MIYTRYSLLRDPRVLFCAACNILNNEFKTHPIRFFSEYTNVQKFVERTHTCDTVNADFIGEEINMCGWLDGGVRQNKYLILRDNFGSIQLVFSDEKEKEIVNVLKKLNDKRLIEVTGVVCSRRVSVLGTKNGHIELAIKKLAALDPKTTEASIVTSPQKDIDRSVNSYTSRTHTCGDVNFSNLGEEVKLCGWVEHVRVNKFIRLRDAYGMLHIVIKDMNNENALQTHVHMESVIQVNGIVRSVTSKKRESKDDIVIEAKSIKVLNEIFAKTRYEIRDFETCETEHNKITDFNDDAPTLIPEEIYTNQDLYGYERGDPFRMQEKYNELIEKTDSYEKIFTDASKINSQIGYAIKHRDTIIARKLPPCTKVSEAEMLAIRESLLYILDKENISAAIILSDSLGTIRSLNKPISNNKLLREIQELCYVAKLFDIKIQLWWVPSHCGIEGNETVDQIAKNVTKSEQPIVDDIRDMQDKKYPIKIKINEIQKQKTNENIENECDDDSNKSDDKFLLKLRTKLFKMSQVSEPKFSKGNFRFGIDKVVFGCYNYQQMNKRYRFLALRFSQFQDNLRVRSKVVFKMRKFLTSKNFVEVETPTLVKRTPDLGQQFIVPTHLKNQFYSLVRSPLQLKQLLMVGSLDRCFQIARCYSDENTNSERQPEFTQLHIALSFTDSENLMRLTEDVFIASLPESETAISTPFPRMTYDEAFDKYGQHKPTLLNKLLIYNLKNYTNYSAFIYMFIVPQVQSSSRKWRQRFHSLRLNPSVEVHVVKARSKEKTYSEIENIFPDFQCDIFENHFTLDPNDLIVFSEGPTKDDTLKALGTCRCDVIDHLGLIDELTEKGIYEFVWIVNPPLFETNELGELKSTYHPFTRPQAVDDVGLIPDQTMKLRSLAYNLILNGSEIVCASLCNHDVKLQKAIFKLLNIREEDHDYLLEALEMGCPPHGVIAWDVDRLLALICGCKSVQDVIAFPKADGGEDLMTGCPSDVPLADKIRYHIHSANYVNKDSSECYI